MTPNIGIYINTIIKITPGSSSADSSALSLNSFHPVFLFTFCNGLTFAPVINIGLLSKTQIQSKLFFLIINFIITFRACNQQL